jgi:predicted adenine nucleotide alpha hydrolase (AANH) superfamily ATPase
MTIETKEEIKARLEARKKFTSRKPIKIINSTYIREYCHAKGVKISEEGLKELANMNRRILNSIIEDTKELGFKVVLRRHIERRVIG